MKYTRISSAGRLATPFIALGLALATGLVSCSYTKTSDPAKEGASASGAHEDPDGYFTCPMHPEVHEHKPGMTCPMCGMALVKVKPKKAEAQSPAAASGDEHAGHGVAVGGRELELAGIKPIAVERKDLTFSIPVSGRLVSSRSVAFQVYESDLQVMRVGLEFKGSMASAPSELIKGRITLIDTLLDPSSRTVRAVGELERAPQSPLIEGAFHGEIIGVLKNQIAVPEDAVLHTGRESLVYLATEKGTLKPQSVRLGIKAGASYQVLSGLNEGDKISSGPNFLIDSETKIRGGNDQKHH